MNKDDIVPFELTRGEAETICEAIEGLDVWLDDKEGDLEMHNKMFAIRTRLIREFHLDESVEHGDLRQ
jgi:hypothetical protein